jgi:DEAD/DEAH box helicase domain-containing protein
MTINALILRANNALFPDPDSGLLKGPWVQCRRPFCPADAHETMPFNFRVAFDPFKHQIRSWRRLSGESQVPNPMFVATPAGSGRTRDLLFCFRCVLLGSGRRTG